MGHYLDDPASIQKMDEQINSLDYTESSIGWDNYVLLTGWDSIIISSVNSSKNQQLVGKNVHEISRVKGIRPIEVVANLLREENFAVGMIIDKLSSENNIEKTLQHPLLSAVGSDSIFEGKPHPRTYGNFPRLLSYYVRDRNTLTLSEAIHKMTYSPALKLGLKERGKLGKGFAADICIFDRDTIEDMATISEPETPPQGIYLSLIHI